MTHHPKDRNGTSLKVLDFVVIGEIPSHYYSDPGITAETSKVLNSYSGKYGLITYPLNERYYPGTALSPSWLSLDGTHVHVLSHAINHSHVSSYDFWLPSITLEKIPQNLLIQSVFAEFSWEMECVGGQDDVYVVVQGMEQFDLIKAILDAPYDVLKTAHEAAMAVLERTQNRDDIK